MLENNICLYNNNFIDFYNEDNNSIFGKFSNNYHGDAQTTTREAWKEEISIIKNLIAPYKNEDGQVIFEYDIPRLGKKLMLLYYLKELYFV